MGQWCKQLEDLNLRFCEGLTDAGLVELAPGCGKSLKTLGIATCARITDTSLEAIGLYCTSLQTLSLDSDVIKNQGVLSIAKGCPSLKVLKLHCVNVTDDALLAVGAYCVSLELLALNSFQRFTDKCVFVQYILLGYLSDNPCSSMANEKHMITLCFAVQKCWLIMKCLDVHIFHICIVLFPRPIVLHVVIIFIGSLATGLFSYLNQVTLLYIMLTSFCFKCSLRLHL